MIENPALPGLYEYGSPLLAAYTEVLPADQSTREPAMYSRTQKPPFVEWQT